MAIAQAVLDVCKTEDDPEKAWKKIEPILKNIIGFMLILILEV